MATIDDEVPGPSKKAKCLGESIIVDLQDVVKILVTDTVLIENWKKFYYSLKKPSSKIVQWDRSFKNNTMTIEDILIDILSHWVKALGKEAKVGRLYAALISQEFIAVADALTKQYDLSCKIGPMAASNQSETTNSEDDAPITFDLCEPSNNFVGRTHELHMLDTFYREKTKLIVVSGLGGVGKSEFVRKFGIKFRNDVRGSCIWIQGDSEESSKNSFKKLAGRISLKFKLETDILDIFEEVYNRKLKQWPVLIIVDNVDKSNSSVIKLIKGCKRLLDNIPLIIVTTRNKSVLQIEGGNIELKMLERGEAVQMVTNGLGSGVSLFEAIKLCDALNNFPLIVQQAISFIKQKRSDPFEQNFGVSEYLELFDKEKEKLMDSPLNDDDNYNSTTFATWGMILDNLKQMNGSTGSLAVNILRTLPYFNANGVELSQLVKFHDNIAHKTTIESEQGRQDSEGIKKAITLIQTYSMCRVDSMSYCAALGEYLEDYKISSHRLIRHFMLLSIDTEMDEEILRRLFFGQYKPWLLDEENVDKLAQSYKALVVEMFTKFYKLDDEDEQICPSELEVYKKKFYDALETYGLNIHFVLKFEDFLFDLYNPSKMLEHCHTINQYVRRRYGLDHFLSRFLREQICGMSIIFEPTEIPIDIFIGFLVDGMDDGLIDRSELIYWNDSIMESLLNGAVPIEMSNLVVELKESVTNYYDFNENYDELFTFSILTAISQFFKRNEDIDRYNQIQSEMSCLMQHSSELITIWQFIKHRLGTPSFVKAFIFNNYNDIADGTTLSYLLNSPHLWKSWMVDNLFHESKEIGYLDLFTMITIAMGSDKKDGPSDIISHKLDSYLINKDLILRVIQTIIAFEKDALLSLYTDREDILLALYTEITESVRNGLVNSYEGIWSLGQIYKALWTKFRKRVKIELIDTMEGLVNTEKDKELVKTILCSIVDRFVWDDMYRISLGKDDKIFWRVVIPLFLRLQKYGLYFSILKRILQSASVEQIVAIGSSIIDNYREGLTNKADTFLAIKQVVKSFLRKQEKEKAFEILCQCLNIEHLIPSDGNQKKLLFEKVHSTVVHLDDINIATATYFYFGKCTELNDPRESDHPCILLPQILKILCKEQNPTQLLALCYEIYHFEKDSCSHRLKCWALIQLLKSIVEMNRNELAERFLKKLIKTYCWDDWRWYYMACWFLVFRVHYKARFDTQSTLDTLKVEDCVKILESYENLIKKSFFSD